MSAARVVWEAAPRIAMAGLATSYMIHHPLFGGAAGVVVAALSGFGLLLMVTEDAVRASRPEGGRAS